MLPAFLSHPAACLVMPLGAAPLHAEVTFARKHEQLIPACLEPVEQKNVVGFAVQGSNKWSEMGLGGAPHQPLLCCLSPHPPALPNNSVECKKLPSVAKSCSELQALEKGGEAGTAQERVRVRDAARPPLGMLPWLNQVNWIEPSAGAQCSGAWSVVLQGRGCPIHGFCWSRSKGTLD